MSELEKEMTLAEKTRNELDATHDESTQLAEGIAACAAVAFMAEDVHLRSRPELQCVLRHALYELAEHADRLDANIERVAGWYAGERTITECAHAIADRQDKASGEYLHLKTGGGEQ
jgi:hypothetical protein